MKSKELETAQLSHCIKFSVNMFPYKHKSFEDRKESLMYHSI